MKTALLISTYNRPKALKVCLESVRKQSTLPDEVVIADDGSKEDTKELIEEIAKDFPVPIKHIWHEDKGFRLAKIRNKGIAATDADFIIQIDGDVFLHKNLVQDYISIARRGFCILGPRVYLNEKLTARIEESQKVPKIRFWSKGIERKRLRTIYSKLGRRISNNFRLNSTKVMGCNIAFWKNDCIAVNGYDESFIGWGCEDCDFIERLLKNGNQNHKVRLICNVYHLWHKEFDKSTYKTNLDIWHKRNNNIIRCQQGISQYL